MIPLGTQIVESKEILTHGQLHPVIDATKLEDRFKTLFDNNLKGTEARKGNDADDVDINTQGFRLHP